METIKNAKQERYVYSTTDYSIFKLMLGNRPIEPSRVEKIKRSILKNGYVFSPIIVNENMEIIDGQGRLTALRALNMPVDYIVKRGLNLKSCVTQNTVRTGWKNTDFIKSFADVGNEDCQRLHKLITEYKGVPPSTIFNTVRKAYSRWHSGGADRNPLNLRCSEADFLRVWNTMQYAQRFLPTLKKKSKGARDILLSALAFAYEQTDINTERLFNNFEKLYLTDRFVPFASNFMDALNSLSDIYNYNLRNTISLAAAFVAYSNRKGE